MGQQVSEMFARTGRQVLGFAIAHSENSLADYIVDLRKYESLIPNIVSHYIVLCNLKDDTLPNRNTDTGRSKFVYDDGFRIVESENRRPYQQVYYQLSKYNLRMVSYFFGKVTRYRVQLPWNRHETLSIVINQLKNYLMTNLKHGSSFLASFGSNRASPLLFCIAPIGQHIRRGKVSFEDPQRDDKMIFADICRRHNIGFIDLTERFNDFFLKTNKFPRGFANTFPGRGHLNAHGHRIVAEAIFSNELSRDLVN